MKSVASIATLFAALLVSFNVTANADTVALFTFETSVPTTAGPHNPEGGAGMATGSHASMATAYSNPSGNGSLESFSSNTWAAGDYYQFAVSTSGLENISFAWDHTGSGTGPRDFDLQYDAGAGFVTATSYALGGESWSAGTANPASTRSFDFSAISALDNNSSVLFRLTAVGTASIGGGTVAAGGTSRVDNILIEGTPIGVVPEPSTAVLGFGLMLIGIGSRRRSK